MSRSQVCFFAICFSTVGVFASVGFSQDFYQSTVAYSEPYISQPYAAQYMPSQLPVASVVGTPVADYGSSLGVPTQTYSVAQEGVIQEGVVQEGVVQEGVVQGSVFQDQGAAMIISPDYGYAGPGDMRTHLWKHHSNDLKANGVSYSQLMSMSMATVQKWHNFFHGSEGRPQQ